MRLLGLLLVVVLSDGDAAVDLLEHECEDCHDNGHWYPLFHPSQIISSELPEHEQYHYAEPPPPPPLTYATARPQVSGEVRSGEAVLRSREVGVDIPVRGYGQHHSAEPPPPLSYHTTRPQVSEEVVLGSREVGVDTPVRSYGQHHSAEPPPPPPLTYHTARPQVSEEAVVLGSREVGVDTPVRSYGQHRVEWDHYGDVTTVATVAHNSVEGGAPPSGEDRSDSRVRSQEEAFFDNGSFFEDKHSSVEQFEVSNEFPFSGEHHHHGDSAESHEYMGRPVATSYASISSVFESRPIPRARDLLHPELALDIPHYLEPRGNRSRQYRVHEPLSREILSRNNKPPPLGHRPTSYIPLDHPVYRYVKVHGGSRPQSRSTLRWDDLHPVLRSRFPFKYLRPRVHVQSHETLVRHVVPTKDPFADSFFRESQKTEDLKPPPLGQTLYFFKKKPIDVNNIRRQSPGYMYIIRRNKKQH